MFAMPENVFAFYVNAGANYFLGRSHVGLYAALTGAKIIGADVVRAHLTPNLISSQNIGLIEKDLVSMDEVSDETVTKTIDKYRVPLNTKSKLNFGKISEHFQGDSLEQVLESLRSDPDEWSQKTLAMINRASALSLKVTFELFRQAKANNLNAKEALELDFVVGTNFFDVDNDGSKSDVLEGLKATLVNKNHKPSYRYNTLASIPDAELRKYFADDRARMTRRAQTAN